MNKQELKIRLEALREKQAAIAKISGEIGQAYKTLKDLTTQMHNEVTDEIGRIIEEIMEG